MIATSRSTMIACVTVAALTCGSPALAGEATGNFATTGKRTPIEDYVAASICAFSGQNPERFGDPEDPDYTPDRTQSWGRLAKSVRDTLPTVLQPGSACNGHTGLLAGRR